MDELSKSTNHVILTWWEQTSFTALNAGGIDA
jgi:hypothetical protein